MGPRQDDGGVESSGQVAQAHLSFHPFPVFISRHPVQPLAAQDRTKLPQSKRKKHRSSNSSLLSTLLVALVLPSLAKSYRHVPQLKCVRTKPGYVTPPPPPPPPPHSLYIPLRVLQISDLPLPEVLPSRALPKVGHSAVQTRARRRSCELGMSHSLTQAFGARTSCMAELGYGHELFIYKFLSYTLNNGQFRP